MSFLLTAAGLKRKHDAQVTDKMKREEKLFKIILYISHGRILSREGEVFHDSGADAEKEQDTDCH